MDAKNNVIDFVERKRLKSNGKTNKKRRSKATASADVTDITKIREDMINDERRRVKRTMLTKFIGAHVVIPGKGLMKVTLYDISEDGIAFDMEDSTGMFQPNEEVVMRVYMNNQTYFPFLISISHIAHVPEERVYRHGSRFVKDTVNEVALYHFVRFIECVSANLKGDHGDVTVSNIK